jgi:hypothetical protein
MMIKQIGQFFLFLGLIGMIIFCGTLQVRQPAYAFCIWGSLGLIFGVVLLARAYQPPPPNTTRFRLLRRSKEKSEKKHE